MQMRAIHSVISHVEGEGFVTHAPGSVFEIDDATAADLDARGAASIVDAAGASLVSEAEPEADTQRSKRGRRAQAPDADASPTVGQADASDASEDQPAEATE